MKRVINILCLGILLTAVACSEETPNIPPFVGSGEEALETGFFEDFTESTVDATKWAICPANQYANWKKFMGQIPLESYVPVDGVLSLQAVSPAEYGQPATNAPFCMGLQTMKPSGLVLYAFRYGEVTVRARFSTAGDGAWPAIWLMPVDENSTTWPEAGEIDIMEHYNSEAWIEHAVHYTQQGGGNASKSAKVTASTAGLNLSEYNIYGVRKTPGKLEWTVNGEVTFTVTQTQVEADGGIWPFESRDYYIIINQSCAPMQSYGGNAWRASWLPSLDVLPYEMSVDWVRVVEEE